MEEHDQIHVVWDGYDLNAFSDKNFFMEGGISTADFIAIITTKKYKQKADDRAGGVGIETFLTSNVHWQSLLETKQSKIIVVAREKDSAPNYLKGAIYIDAADEKFNEAVHSVLNHVLGTSKITRPPKVKSFIPDESLYSFTKVEELIKITHSNRSVIVNSEEGTDFSGSNRVKYELWETKSPALNYFLALANNINISQTINHAIEKLTGKNIKPSELTVLRPYPGRAEQALIQGLFKQSGLNTKVHEFTYKNYLWGFCIDDGLKTTDAPSTVANYTDQSLLLDSPDSSGIKSSALDFFSDELTKESRPTAHLVVAPGGMGKTALCLSVAKKLHNRSDLQSTVIFIQAEAIKRYIADQGIPIPKIDSIFHLYELYARVQEHDQVFDKTTFDLAVLCGNLRVIIDGLDELTTLFQERFRLEPFLASIKTLHDQLGSSNVLLTTRNNLLIDSTQLETLEIESYELLGFDKNSCEKYFNKRFKGFSNLPNIIKKGMALIEKARLIESDTEQRVLPFFADIVATVMEDQITKGDDIEFQIDDGQTPYPSNNELTDHIIHSVLRREETRHGLDISVNEVIQLLSGLVADHGREWKANYLKESLELLYDARSQALYSKISISPLLIQHPDHFELRYGFLSSYFEVLFLLDGIQTESIANEFIRSLSRLTPDSTEFKELRKYFQSRTGELELRLETLIRNLKQIALSNNDETNNGKKEHSKRAIASLLTLFASLAKRSATDLREKLLEIYGVDKSSKPSIQIEGLFITGDFPPLDFSDLVVIKSRFQNYQKFLSSKFSNTRFLFCVFGSCGNEKIHNSSIESSMIDSSCDIGDLREVLEQFKSGKKDEDRMIEGEVKKFLHSFFKGDRFIDNNKTHIRFSAKVAGLADNKFDRLITSGFLKIKREKEVDTFYEVTENFQPSVRRLLTNNYTDGKMKDFINFLKG